MQMPNRSCRTGCLSRRGLPFAVFPLLCHVVHTTAATITIVANPSSVASIPEAAVAEERVDFRDNDPADDAACTESFAATELRHFLAVCAKLDEADVRFALPDRLPPEGDVFVLGSRNSNPLINQVDPHAGAAKALRVPESFRLHHRGDEAMARQEFVSVERMADRLRGIVDLVQVAYRHANAKNGLDASQAEPAYEFRRKRYGTASTRGGP